MINFNKLDLAYEEFTKDLSRWIPDGIIPVNLELISSIGFLGTEEEAEVSKNFSENFLVYETEEKVTLYNEQFAIWIIPTIIQKKPTTICLLAILNDGEPHLELAFSTGGIYNTPRYILQILSYYLSEILDTEKAISHIKNNH